MFFYKFSKKTLTNLFSSVIFHDITNENGKDLSMDSGSIAFIMICSALVMLMSFGLAFFYGGLGRRKNVINTMMMAVIPLGMASLFWVLEVTL